MNLIDTITPASYFIQNNHTIKRTILISLKEDYVIFDKYQFSKEIEKKGNNISEKTIKNIFEKHIRKITEENSKKIFSSRLINNALENERFHLTPRNEEDKNFLKEFYKDKNVEPHFTYLYQAAYKSSGKFDNIEKNIERIFNNAYYKETIDSDDISDIKNFSILQICKNKENMLHICNNLIEGKSICIEHLKEFITKNDIENIKKKIHYIRETIFRKQLEAKNSNNLFTYKWVSPIYSEKNFWLGDCDTLFDLREKQIRTCYCRECKCEDDSTCIWENIPTKQIFNATTFVCPNLLLNFNEEQYNEEKEEKHKIISKNWNKEVFQKAVFHILIDKNSKEELFKMIIEKIQNRALSISNNHFLYDYSLEKIDNFNFIEHAISKIKNPPLKLDDESLKFINEAINKISNEEVKEVNLNSIYDYCNLIEKIFKNKKIKIYEDLYKHPEHKGLYIAKRINPTGGYYIYTILKGKG